MSDGDPGTNPGGADGDEERAGDAADGDDRRQGGRTQAGGEGTEHSPADDGGDGGTSSTAADDGGDATPIDPAATTVEPAADGVVYLVGSGPGDPALLTVRARRLLETADVVLHDKLSGPVLDLVPERAREDVGKRAGGERTPQSAINERMVELAGAGKSVVRLKGGDPFVFGRGGEESEYLAEHGVDFEVVPAVTSAVAAPEVAGIPLTHRDHASSVSIVTGHEDPTKEESAVDWEALAATGGTIVVLMGVGKLGEYATALRDAGMAPETPLALIERATWPGQHVATGTLGTAVEARDEAGIEPPAVTVIGEVAASRERVRAFLRTDRRYREAGNAGDGGPEGDRA